MSLKGRIMLLRYRLLGVGVLAVAAACTSAGKPESPAAEMLQRIKQVRAGGTLDYAVARQFLGVPLDAFRYAAIVSGDRILSRAGEYHIRNGRGDPPGFDSIRFDMTWQADNNGPSLQRRHGEKGLRSSLRVSFDQQNICITKDMLKDEWGKGRDGRFSHGDSESISYGDADRMYVSFTFHQPTCAASVDIGLKDSAARWITPADASAGDVEFFASLLPIDKSGRQFISLGFECGPSGSASSGPDDRGCVCPREKQTRNGPCHHAVTFHDENADGVTVRVWPLLNPEAN